MRVRVRPLRAEDADAIHAIFLNCLRIDLAPRLVSRAIEAWLAGCEPVGYEPAITAGDRYLVAEAAGVVVGYASHSGGELTSLFVAPDYQRCGTGTALFLACDRETDITFISASPRSVAFYERFGFSRGPDHVRANRGAPLPHVELHRR